MTDYREWKRRLKLRPSLAVHRAAILLERHGCRFLVDFGTRNAVEKAMELRKARRQGIKP